MIDGQLYHFSGGGLYNGLILLIDDETGSYWDHITGMAVHGPMAGQQMESWPLIYTTVEAADGALTIHRPKRSLMGSVMGFLHRKGGKGQGFLPPFFRLTMGAADERLPEMTHGLGVIVGKRAKFYPMQQLKTPIVDDWQGRALDVGIGTVDGVPYARWQDDQSRPMQLLSRWYGFAYSYPGCDLFERKD